MSPHLTAILAGGGHLLAPGSSTGDTGFSFTQDSGQCWVDTKISVCLTVLITLEAERTLSI